MELNIMISMMIMRTHTWLVMMSMSKPFSKVAQISQEQIITLEERGQLQGPRQDNSRMLVMRTLKMRS